MKCPACGVWNKQVAAYCRYCGCPLNQPGAGGAMHAGYGSAAFRPPKSMLAAALLAFFLGVLGIHNFYLGYSGRGVAQLLITLLTCGYGVAITGVWSLVEFVMILCRALPDSRGRPLQ